VRLARGATRIRRAAAALLLLAGASLLARPAQAGTRRFAVIVGNNQGSGAQPPLRYAEDDAAKLAGVLTELAGVAPGDLQLLRGGRVADLLAALDRVKTQASRLQPPGERALLIFYFSGHSDGLGLELGRERLAFAELRERLRRSGTDVRLAIIDSCKSGSLLAAKGGRLLPAFQIRLSSDLASRGEAFLTSSAADELALESREIRGSFFTHHLVSGLRGAADGSGDGKVTLAEAYQYAFAHTVSATSGTVVGPQHPGYDYRLTGEGDLVLTELHRPAAQVVLPGGFERFLLVGGRRHPAVLAELSGGQPGEATTGRRGPVKVAVPDGPLEVRAWQNGRYFIARLDLGKGQVHTLALADLREAPVPVTVSKGDDAEPVSPARPPARIDLWVGAGVQRPVSVGVPVMGAYRVFLASAATHGPTVSLTVAEGSGQSGPTQYLDLAATAQVGYRIGLLRQLPARVALFGAFHLWGGLEAGGGVVSQRLSFSGVWSSSGLFTGGGVVGLALQLGRSPLWFSIDGTLPVWVFKRDAGSTASFVPSGLAALGTRF
jgi:hypothetical protein